MTGHQTLAGLHRAAAAVRAQLEGSVLREPDLTWTAYMVLRVVQDWGEGETRHVAAEAGISKGTLTGVVKTLEVRGLLTRARHLKDRRLVLLSLTPHGERLMARLAPQLLAAEERITGRLGPADRAALGDLLGRIVTQVEEQRRSC